MCLSALLLTATATAEKKSLDSKVPLEKKLDKRGLLNLGYGYGINGLDLGYLGKSDFAPAFAVGSGHHDLGLSYGYGGHVGYGGPYISDVTKTVTLVKNVPYPVEKPVAVPYAVDKPYPVEVSLMRENCCFDP